MRRRIAEIRNLDGTWEVTDEDGCKCFYAGIYADTNIIMLYGNPEGKSTIRLMTEAKANRLPFDCAEHAHLFRKYIQFHSGSWHRLHDGTWIAKSSQAAVRGCLLHYGLDIRKPHLKLMLAYLKEHP